MLSPRSRPFRIARRALALVALPALTVSAALAQQSAALFDAPLAQLPQDSSAFKKMLDLDADGFLDAVGVRMRTDVAGSTLASAVEVTTWLNDQTGRFVEAFKQVYAPPAGAAWTLTAGHVSVGNLNGDARADFVWCADQGASEVWRFTTQPNGVLARQTFPMVQPVVDVELADFDADGIDDVAVLMSSTTVSSLLQIFWATGGTTQVPGATMCCTTTPNLLVVDTNIDGLPDLFVGGTAGGRPYTITNGQLGAGPAFNLSFAPSMWADGDVDGDGDEDLVAFHMGSPFGVYQVLRKTSVETYVLESAKIGGPAEYLADIDADGDLDGVCCGGSGGCSLGALEWPKLTFNSRYEMSINDGSGAFTNAYSFWNAGSTSLAGAVDVDHDGDVDLVAGRTVYYSRGGLAKPYPTLAQGSDRQATVFDWDGDGDDEPLMWSTDLANWYRNLGDGSFGYVPRVFNGVMQGSWLEPELDGDFDGDGDADVVRRQQAVGQALYPAHIWRNNGGGAFPSVELASNGTDFFFGTSAPASTGTFDLDLDGDLDGWTNDTNGWWDQYRNGGNGWFDAKTRWNGEEVAATADFDQDGWIDAVVVTSSAGFYALAIRRGSASGLAAATSELGNVSSTLPTVAIGDFNGDARPDIACLDSTKHARLFTSPRGIGGVWGDSLLSSTQYTGADPAISAFDVDGDTRADIVVGSHDSKFGTCNNAVPTRDVFWQVASASVGGAPAFAGPRTFVMSSKLVLDLDGDGDRDLIGRAANEWYVHRNTANDGSASRVQYGAGASGASGAWPTLGASGPFEVGASPALRLTGGQAGSKAFLAVALDRAELPGFPFPGMTTHVNPFGATFVVVGIPTPGVAGVVGSGKSVVRVAVDPSWVGLSWYHQAFPIDLGTPNFVSATNGLEIVYGL